MASSSTSQQPANAGRKTFELVDAPPQPLSWLAQLPHRRQQEIAKKMEYILIRPEARIDAKLVSLRIGTWGALGRWMERNGGKVTREQERELENECVLHFLQLEWANFTAWPKRGKDAVTGLKRGYRNWWPVVPDGWFDMQALREKEEMVEKKEKKEGDEDMEFGLLFDF